MLAFVQACDGVYKKLRFLRASLSNSSKIDSVLEDIFNFLFYCSLALLICKLTYAHRDDPIVVCCSQRACCSYIFSLPHLIFSVSLIGLDPWPILASFSAITVSFAFAFGNSVAKQVEGILFIAVRRPYDIGECYRSNSTKNA